MAASEPEIPEDKKSVRLLLDDIRKHLHYVGSGPAPDPLEGSLASVRKLTSLVIEFDAQAKHLQDLQLMIKARQHVLQKAFTASTYAETPPALTAALDRANFEIEKLRLEFRELYPKLSWVRPRPTSNFRSFAELESDD
ncbi:MAG: hypothetical protein Q9176_003927 [Flavoplaca citrina]